MCLRARARACVYVCVCEGGACLTGLMTGIYPPPHIRDARFYRYISVSRFKRILIRYIDTVSTHRYIEYPKVTLADAKQKMDAKQKVESWFLKLVYTSVNCMRTVLYSIAHASGLLLAHY